MQALDALLNRVSVPRLGEPAPTAAQRELLFRAALRAPDHAQLRPWRFLTVEGEARGRLGELLASAVLAADPQAPAAALEKARAMPLRAPLLVLVIARLNSHFKVPQNEQVLSAACAAHGLLLAAHALGYVAGALRTEVNSFTDNPLVLARTRPGYRRGLAHRRVELQRNRCRRARPAGQRAADRLHLPGHAPGAAAGAGAA